MFKRLYKMVRRLFPTRKMVFLLQDPPRKPLSPEMQKLYNKIILDAFPRSMTIHVLNKS